MEAKQIVDEIQLKIEQDKNPENIPKIKHFFKEDIITAGWFSPKIKSFAKNYIRIFKKEKDFNKLLDVTERLFVTARMEEVSLGLEILRHFHNIYTPQMFRTFNQWVDYLTNWAHTDDLSTKHIAPLISMDNTIIKQLLKWTKSPNRWRRRCSVVSLVPEARKGNLLPEILKVSGKLMKDTDIMVQKGVGWLLKEAGKNHPKEVAEFLLKWKDKTTRLVLIYACQKLPESLKKKVLS
jgi:3-methyladenine DNA glycosylase AlkD